MSDSSGLTVCLLSALPVVSAACRVRGLP